MMSKVGAESTPDNPAVPVLGRRMGSHQRRQSNA